MIRQILLFLVFFLSGFARIEYTKFLGVQAFVIIAIIFISYCFFVKKSSIAPSVKGTAVYSYRLFLFWSFPAFIIGAYYSVFDALYFYVYTIMPLLLYKSTNILIFDFKKFLFAAEISLLIVVCLGWGIYFGLLPINFLFTNVTQAEIDLGYWGISYLESSRNHDYMYPLVGGSIAMYLYKNENIPYKRIFYLFCFAFMEITILASLSRGGMIVALLYFVLFFYGLDKRGRIVSSIIAISILLIFYDQFKELIDSFFSNIFLSIFGLSETTHYGGTFSNALRKMIYEDAINAAMVNPIGYGIQNFIMTSNIGGGSAENAYLTVVVERGWIATVFFVQFLIRIWKETRRTLYVYSLNFYLLPAIAIYFLFNYEFTSYMCVFVFYLLLISNRFSIHVQRKD